MLALGQNAASRRIVVFDPAWLYETSRTENFQHGLYAISHHLYVKSLSGGNRGWAGHCAWNRVPGAVMAREPETVRATKREALWLCRINDPRLVSTRSGIVWNFPAAAKGVVEIDCRIDDRSNSFLGDARRETSGGERQLDVRRKKNQVSLSYVFSSRLASCLASKNDLIVCIMPFINYGN